MKKKFITSILTLLCAVSVFGAVGCKEKNPVDSSPSETPPSPPPISVTFNETNSVACNELFLPSFTLSENTSITKVELIGPDGEPVSYASDYSFTPSVYGRYLYRVTVEREGEFKVFTFDVISVDASLPVVKSMPADKTIDIGVYTGFEADLAQAVVEDDNVAALKYLTRKVVKIELNGSVCYENDNGIGYYLFKTQGEYTVTAAFADVAGGTSYATYKIIAQDTVKPTVQAFPTYYVWAKEGKITLPTPEVYDLSGCTVVPTVSKGGSNVTVSNNSVVAAAGDLFDVVYTVTDGNGNRETAPAKVKVLAEGTIIDGAEADFASLFTAEDSHVEYDETNHGVAFINNGPSDVVEWKENGYFYSTSSDYNAVELTVRSYAQNSGSVLVSATQDGEKVFVGKITLETAAGGYSENTYVLDISKTNLTNIDGWSFDYAADVEDTRFVLTDMRFTSYVANYLEVSELASTAKVGEPITLGSLTVNGSEVSNTYVNIYKMNGSAATLIDTKPVNSTYTFASAGEWKVEFTAETGNKTHTVAKTVTVAGDHGASLSFGGDFEAGTVGVAYALPTATATGGTLSVSVVDPDSAEVTLSNGSFTPAKAGVYAATYTVGAKNLGKYLFAIEAEDSVDFEQDAAYQLKTVYNGGFKKNTDERFVNSGLLSARADVPANKFAGGMFQTPYNIKEGANHIAMHVYASTAGAIRVSTFIGASNVEYVSSTFELEQGDNEISFFIDGATAEGFSGEALKGMVIHNLESYANVYFVDNLRFAKSDAISDSEIFAANASATLYVEETKALFVPNVVICSSGLIKSASATFKGEGLTLPVAIGAKVNVFTGNEIVVGGNYAIEYTVVDIFNRTHTVTRAVDISTLGLQAELRFGDHYVAKSSTFPDPVLTSTAYDESVLNGAIVEKYYKTEGSDTWILVDGEVSFVTVGMIDVRYVITLPAADIKLVVSDESFVHANGVFFDFESHANGKYLGQGLSYSNRISQAQVVSDWSHDGNFSMYIPNNPNYEDCSGWIYGVRSQDPDETILTEDSYTDTAYGYTYPFTDYKVTMDSHYDIGFEADAVVFWAKSEIDTIEHYIEFDNYDWKASTGNFSFKKGVHKYVVPLSKPLRTFKRMMFFVNRSSGYWIDSISFVNLADISYQDLEGAQFPYSADGFEFTRPVVNEYSEIAYSAEQIASAKAYAIVSDGANETTYDLTTDKKYHLDPAEYSVIYYIEIGDQVFSSEKQYFTIRPFDLTFHKPPIVFNSGEATSLQLPTGNETGVNFSVFYRHYTATDWTEVTDMTATHANVTLTAVGNYEMRFVAEKGDIVDETVYKVLVRSEDVIADFEIMEDDSHHGEGPYHYNSQGDFSREWSHDGEWSFHIVASGISFFRIDYGANQYDGGDYTPEQLAGHRTFAKSYNAITMVVNTKTEITNLKLEIEYANNKWAASEPVNIKTGVHEVTFLFEKTFDTLYAFGFVTNYQANTPGAVTNMYIDSVVAKLIGVVEEPAVGDTAYAGYSFSFGGCTSDSEFTETVKYKYSDETDYTTVEKVGGVYKFTPTKLGTVTVEFTVQIDGIEKNFTYTVTVKDLSGDPAKPDIDWE